MKLLTLLITLTTLAGCLSAGLKLCNIDSVAGCKENNMCAHLQNGECTVSDDGQCGYKCVCKSGWKGDKCDERVSSWSLVMKLKAGSSEFKYDSAYWTNSATLNPSSTTAADTDNIDAKLDAFNTVEVDAFKVCYNTLSNCYEYTLPQTYSSAKALFSAGHVRLTSLNKEAFTDLFLPPGTPTWYDDFWNGHGGGKCGMQRPGINTQCADNNWARIGYCVNLPDQPCQPHDHNDADSPIGIGLKTQNWPNNVNAPFGEYTIHGAGSSVVAQFQHQAWLFVKNNKRTVTASELANAQCTKAVGTVTMDVSSNKWEFHGIPEDHIDSAAWYCDVTTTDEFIAVDASYRLTSVDPKTGVRQDPDDNAAMTSWGADTGANHKGYFSFGTRDNILDAGGTRGGDLGYQTPNNQVDVTFQGGSVSRTNVVRFGFSQSANHEDFSIDNVVITITLAPAAALDSFKFAQNNGFYGCHIQKGDGETYEQCAQHCLDYGDNCGGFEVYKPAMRCYIFSRTWQELANGACDFVSVAQCERYTRAEDTTV